MSIAENEAREEYWNEYGLQAVMLRTAYVTGRTAEPCDEQIEAAAKVLADWSDPSTDLFMDRCRHIAKLMLEEARKAVSE